MSCNCHYVRLPSNTHSQNSELYFELQMCLQDGLLKILLRCNSCISKNVLIANGTIHGNLSKKSFNYFAQCSNFKDIFIHSCATNQLHWGWTLSKHRKRENKIRCMGGLTKREHISLFQLPYMGLSAWPWGPIMLLLKCLWSTMQALIFQGVTGRDVAVVFVQFTSS